MKAIDATVNTVVVSHVALVERSIVPFFLPYSSQKKRNKIKRKCKIFRAGYGEGRGLFLVRWCGGAEYGNRRAETDIYDSVLMVFLLVAI